MTSLSLEGVTPGTKLVERVKATQLPPPRERRAIRVKARATLQDVGDELGVTANSVSRWERGDEPRPRLAIRYRQLLDALRAATQ
jgi:DNA-binding transcriptional regulator YiaG